MLKLLNRLQSLQRLPNGTITRLLSSTNSLVESKEPKKKQDEEQNADDQKTKETRYKHYFEDEDRRTSLIKFHEEFFDHKIKEKSLKHFLAAIDIYKSGQRQRTYIDFIYGALLKMKEYKADKSLDAYKKLLSVFPLGPLVAKNKWQMDNMHHPRQQNCALAVLEQMERNFICPDEDIARQCIAIFGDWTHVVRKVKRQLYWIPKFRFANKYPLPGPDQMNDPLELAVVAMERMITVDPTMKIRITLTSDVPEDNEDTWIVWAQSEEQKTILDRLDPSVPLYIEGPHFIWLRTKIVEYFVFKTDKLPEYDTKIKQLKAFDENDVSNLENIFINKKVNKPKMSVHEMETGTVLGIASTGTGTKNSCMIWAKILQSHNERLKDFAIIFRVKDKIKEVVSFNNTDDDSKKE